MAKMRTSRGSPISLHGNDGDERGIRCENYSSSTDPIPAPHSPAPRILLAKPGLVTSGPVPGKLVRGGGDDDSLSLCSRLPPSGSLNLLSDSWDFHFDRVLPFLTDNTEFTVIGVIGPPGVGKSTILNELYGFDAISSGLPPFAVQSEESRAMARHCTNGIEPRISVFSTFVLAEMMRPDGSSTVSVLSGESLSAELAHELMGIQVVSEGVNNSNMWRLMLRVDLLKHGIPDPSAVTHYHLQGSNSGPEKENKDKDHGGGEEYMAAPVFVHTTLQGQDISLQRSLQLKKALSRYFISTSFMRGSRNRNAGKWQRHSSVSPPTLTNDADLDTLNVVLIPQKCRDDSPRALYESHLSSLWKLRDQVLSMNCPSFARTMSERDWLKNSAKTWELVKNTLIIAEYCKTLQSSGTFRR
ncbi:hypothetical protein RJ641_007878 [Dillenia turbinata]|uniref:Protein SMG9-like n=1 Tax=Dillenia turbinata TaxID=194707 RepID=A0AAN8Z4G2_9MAGN